MDPLVFLDDRWPCSLSLLRNPPLRLYLLGHACILLGAWLMHVSGSMLPMALGHPLR
jgi:hypothetical protein